jgi:hypothetical protein
MIFYHVTHKTNVRGVRSKGLLIWRAIGQRRVWLATRSKINWAYVHVGNHHQVSVTEMVLLRVDLPVSFRQWIYRWRRGVWCCRVDIPASCIRVERR